MKADWYELGAAARSCPLREDRENEAILVLSHRIKPKDQWREALIASEKALLLILPLRCGRSRLQTGGASSPRDHLLLETGNLFWLLGRIWNPKSSRSCETICDWLLSYFAAEPMRPKPIIIANGESSNSDGTVCRNRIASAL